MSTCFAFSDVIEMGQKKIEIPSANQPQPGFGGPAQTTVSVVPLRMRLRGLP